MGTTRVYHVRAYTLDGVECEKLKFTWRGIVYRATSWYRNLPWVYLIEDITYWTISRGNKILERVERVLPGGECGS